MKDTVNNPSETAENCRSQSVDEQTSTNNANHNSHFDGTTAASDRLTLRQEVDIKRRFKNR